MTESLTLLGINAVLEALTAGARTVNRVYVERGKSGPRIREIFETARRTGVPIEEIPKERLDRLAGGATHQGVAAVSAAGAYANLEGLIDGCRSEGRLIILDGVEDPHNLGAVIRTAAAVGARGVIVPEHRSAGLSPGAIRASAGMVARVPVARCRNAADLANELKEEGFWVAGLDASGTEAWDRVEYPARMALVVGGESKGLRPRVRQSCSSLLAIPMPAGVESLNLSVAVAVVLYEALRQDRAMRG